MRDIRISWRPGRGSVLLSAAVLGMLVTRGFWLPLVGRFLVVEDPLRPADALVPLAGEWPRIAAGAELLKQGYARWFVITEMQVDQQQASPGFRYSESARRQAIEEGVPAKQIMVAPDVVATTYAEARALRRLAQEQGWRSLIVVTSPYHTRRSRIIFRAAFAGSGVTIVVRAMKQHWYHADNWWRFPDSQETTAREYLKLALYLLGYHNFWY
jgi:uncharacterized SAM-binding protein YcdF (DUF218 family)